MLASVCVYMCVSETKNHFHSSPMKKRNKSFYKIYYEDDYLRCIELKMFHRYKKYQFMGHTSTQCDLLLYPAVAA